MKNIGILTSSRADFGIYLPLLKALKEDNELSYTIIAFGTHISKFHGYTVNEIIENDLEVAFKIPTLLSSESEEGISTSAALCALKFSSFWAEHHQQFEAILCLGDRYEMFAAVSSGVPFGINFAHLYGGDISLGAIDNAYRDCLTNFSNLHFTSTHRCKERVKKIKPGDDIVETVGILSMDDLLHLKLLSQEEFKDKWGIDLSKSTILITLHPETVEPQKNKAYAETILETCKNLAEDFQLVITMPNADTEGYVFREKYQELHNLLPERIFLIENFGRTSYFTCLKYATLILGNSSSGISEAASFQKYVINVGDRQKGREVSENTYTVSFNSNQILRCVNKILEKPVFRGENIYRREGGVDTIIQTLKIDIARREKTVTGPQKN